MPKMKRLTPFSIYLLIDGLFAFFFSLIFTVNLLYQANVVGLNPLQLVLVGTLLETVCFICQVPTGVIADVFSRRLAIIFGMILVGVGFMVEGLIPQFAAVLAAQVLWGVGITSISGAQEAWLADEVGEEQAGKTYIRSSQFGQLGGLLGILPAVLLGSIALNLPVLLGGAGIMLTGVFLIPIMPENGFKPTPSEDRTSWQRMVGTTKEGFRLIRHRPALLTILGIGAIYGLSSEGFDRLWRDHLQHGFTFPAIGNFQPVVWFGLIGAALAIFSMTAGEFTRRRLNVYDHAAVARASLLINALMIVGFFFFALAGNFLVAVLAYWLISLMRNTKNPIYTAWINQHVGASVRATVLSVNGQLDALGQIIGGPIFGVIATLVSLRAEMFTVGLTLLPIMFLLWLTLQRDTPQIDSKVSSTE